MDPYRENSPKDKVEVRSAQVRLGLEIITIPAKVPGYLGGTGRGLDGWDETEI